MRADFNFLYTTMQTAVQDTAKSKLVEERRWLFSEL
jgi:hypothetical protein